jgi:hypothetical protein
MSTFQDAVSNLKGKLVEVGTSGEWADRVELLSVASDHLVLLQSNSERKTIIRFEALEYIKELPPQSTVRGLRNG